MARSVLRGSRTLRSSLLTGPLTSLFLLLCVTSPVLPHRVVKSSSSTSASLPRPPASDSHETGRFHAPTETLSTPQSNHEKFEGTNHEYSSKKALRNLIEAEARTSEDGVSVTLLEIPRKSSPRGRDTKLTGETLEHPLGHARYQFFLYDQEGNLVRKWITLQQIQDLLLSHRVRFVSGDNNEVSSDGEALPTAPPTPMLVAGSPWDQHTVIQRPDVNIDGVVDTVHKVMADEMANTAMTESTTLDDQELVTLSNDIIHQLIREQFFQFMADNTHPNHLFKDDQSLDVNGESTVVSVTEGDTTLEENEFETTESVLESTEDSITLSSLQTEQLEKDIALISANLLSNSNSRETDDIDDYSTIHITSVTTDGPTSESTTLHNIFFENNTLNSDYENTSTDLEDFFHSTTHVPSILDITTVSTSGENAPSFTVMSTSDETTQDSIHEDVLITTENNFASSKTSSNLNPNQTDDNTSSSVTTETASTDNVKFASEDILTTENKESPATQHPENLNSTDQISSISYSPSELIDILSEGDYVFPNYLYDYDYDAAAAHFSNVLPPSQMATDAFQDDMDFNDESDLPENYDYYSQKIYLDPETQDYYEKQYHSNEFNISKMSMPSELDFPGKDVAASYHPVEVHSDLVSGPSLAPSSTTTSDAYLAAANPIVGGVSTATTSGESGPETLQKLGVSVAPKTNILSQAPPGNLGLEETIQNLSPTIKEFIATMNDVAFKVYKQGAHLHRSRNFVLSPLNLISVLSMLLLGSRGNTSVVLADLLRTDDFRNFNPHLLLKNIRADIAKKNVDSNIAFSSHVFVELPRKNSVHSLDFFKQTIDYFYGSTAEEADWDAVGAKARVRVNEAITNQTNGRVTTFLDDDVSIQSPFSIVSSALMQSPWSVPVVESDLFDMSFIRFPSAERRLVRTIGISKQMTVNAGYSPEDDATVAEIPLSLLGGELSMILVLPGEQKNFVANGLKQIESRLTPERWSSLLRSMVPHTLTVQVPLFRHRAYTDVSQLLKLIGLDALFQENEADYSGVNSIKSLHLTDVIQLTEFHSCLLENSSFSFRSASYPASLSSVGFRETFQNDITHSSLTENDVLAFQGTSSSLARGKNESTLSSRPTTEDVPGVKDISEEALKETGKSFGTSESINPDVSVHVGREKRKKIVPIRQETVEELVKNDNFLMNTESSNEFGLPRSRSRINSNISKNNQESRVHQSDYFDQLRSLSPEVDHQRNGGELWRKKRTLHRRKHSRNEKGPTVAFDRAFMYVIRHNPTGLILHIGRYLDPI